MYLSEVTLRQWKSYRDATFHFRPPDKHGLVLIGAMNGHGKTSFLEGLYLGLFGRHGLRYVEGLRGDEDVSYYRGEIKKLRRLDATPDEPTQVQLTFAAMPGEATQTDITIERSWFFDANNQPNSGDSFEEVRLYEGRGEAHPAQRVEAKFPNIALRFSLFTPLKLCRHSNMATYC